MKALSVCQPWAWAILHGGKTVENRSRPTRHRGPLVIHASRSRRYVGRDYSVLLPGLPRWDQLEFGTLVGLVEVVDCVPGPWCWMMDNPRPCRPVAYKGHISFFNVPWTLC